MRPNKNVNSKAIVLQTEALRMMTSRADRTLGHFLSEFDHARLPL